MNRQHLKGRKMAHAMNVVYGQLPYLHCEGFADHPTRWRINLTKSAPDAVFGTIQIALLSSVKRVYNFPKRGGGDKVAQTPRLRQNEELQTIRAYGAWKFARHFYKP